MPEKKIYMYIQFHLDNDTVSFNHGRFVGIGCCLLDFIHYNFVEDEDSDDNINLNIHPYLTQMEKVKWPLDRIKKYQDLYRAYFEAIVEDRPEDTPAYFASYRCVCGMKYLREDDHVVVEYMVSELEDCLYLEWLEMMRRNLFVKVCKNCHRFFVPKKGNIDYCQRIFTDNKTCAQVGYAQTFAKNVRNDELLQAYTRAYKAHYARMTKPRKRAANMTREEFEAWYKQARENLTLARQGQLDAEVFLKWLKE